jgi:hypothetical protein
MDETLYDGLAHEELDVMASSGRGHHSRRQPEIATPLATADFREHYSNMF